MKKKTITVKNEKLRSLFQKGGRMGAREDFIKLLQRAVLGRSKR